MIQIKSFLFVKNFLLLGCLGIFFSFSASSSKAETNFSGLGQCHWVGGPYNSLPGVTWGYSSSTPFNFIDSNGATVGDNWSAIETRKGEYQFNQIKSMVDNARSKNKQVWLQIQTADAVNKEHNLPQWALSEGLETVGRFCGNTNYSMYWKEYPLDSGMNNYINNPLYADLSEAQILDSSGKWVPYAVNISATKIRFPKKIAAIWDPRFREYYQKASVALRNYFRKDIEDGIVTGINLMSGGENGESILSPACPFYKQDNYGNACSLPDTINPDCPALKSLARTRLRAEGRTNFTPAEVDAKAVELAKRSNCNPTNTIPGNPVEICTETNQDKCPTENGYPCYVFDDYWMQSVKDMVDKMVAVWAPLPIVWQSGNGLSWAVRVSTNIQNWFYQKYGAFVWLKFNGWGPRYPNKKFGTFTNSLHGYEPDLPYYFSKTYVEDKCKLDYNCAFPDATGACAGKTCCTPENLGVVAALFKTSLVKAINEGLVNEKSSFLCLQSEFYETSSLTTIGTYTTAAEEIREVKSNEYYFNPEDNTPNCDYSEIHVADNGFSPGFGVGWCPGYLNNLFKLNTQSSNIYSNYLFQKGVNVISNWTNFIEPQLPLNCQIYSRKNGFWKSSLINFAQPILNSTNMPKIAVSCK